MFCQRGSEFFLLALCVCGVCVRVCVCVCGVCVGVGGDNVQVQYLFFREKLTYPTPINK